MQDSQGLRPYQTVQTPGESEIIVSKSRFLGFCLPVYDEKAAQDELAKIRKRYFDARHCCYAFRLAEGGIARSSDDGEPSGTAGAPILSVLNGANLENALIAVVRYFGGVLLGTGGLVRAYGKAASDALAASKIVQMRVCRRLKIALSYPAYNMLEPAIRARRHPFKTEFGERVTLTLLLPEEEADAFSADITNRTEGRAVVEAQGKSLEPYMNTKDKSANSKDA